MWTTGTRIVRVASLVTGVSAVVLATGCAAQPGTSPRASYNPVGVAQALSAGSQTNIGQATVAAPQLPTAEPDRRYALTGEDEVSQTWGGGTNGRWIEAGQSRVYIPPER